MLARSPKFGDGDGDTDLAGLGKDSGGDWLWGRGACEGLRGLARSLFISLKF